MRIGWYPPRGTSHNIRSYHSKFRNNVGIVIFIYVYFRIELEEIQNDGSYLVEIKREQTDDDDDDENVCDTDSNMSAVSIPVILLFLCNG